MKNKHIYIVSTAIMVLVTIGLALYASDKKSYLNVDPVLNNNENKIDIIAETSSTTDSSILLDLKSKKIIIPNTDNASVVLGDIVLSKEYGVGTDIVSYGYITNIKNKKVFYILLWRKNVDEYQLISSSEVEQAKDIIGIRASDAGSPSQYYIDVQFTPIGSGNQTQGAIKSVDSKGIH